MTTISIVVPTYFSSRLKETLHGIQAQTAWHAIQEILVVGVQTPGPWIQWPKVHYIPLEDRPTPARNRNRGAAVGSGEWLCFIDSDCVPRPQWLASFLSYVEQYRVSAFTGGVVIPSNTSYWGLCDNLLAFSELHPAIRTTPTFVRYAASLNLCIRREVFLQLNGFDESFPFAAGEDWEFSERLWTHEEKIVFIPEAIVEHWHKRDNFTDAWHHINRYGAAVAQRKQIHGMDWRWQLARHLVYVPGLLKLYGFLRAFWRLPRHLYRIIRINPRYLHALPGIVILDTALSLGMIEGLRSYHVSRVDNSPLLLQERAQDQQQGQVKPTKIISKNKNSDIKTNSQNTLPTNVQLGVVVLNWKNTDETLACIAQLQDIREQFSRMRIAVVDNGSGDNSVFKLFKMRDKKHIDHVIPLSENRGFAAGINAGIQWLLKQGCEYILVLNNDVLLSKSFLKPLYDRLSLNPSAGIATPKIRYVDAPTRLWYAGGLFRRPRILGEMIGIGEEDRGQFDAPCTVDFATGCCMLIKRAVFKKIGFFDEDFFFYHEDIDFSLRTQNAGFSIWYCPESVIWHKVSSSTKKQSALRMYLYAYSRFIFFAKHVQPRQWPQVILQEAVRLIRKTIEYIFYGHLREAIAYVRGTIEGVFWAIRYRQSR